MVRELVSLEHRTHVRSDVAPVIEALASWEPVGGHVNALHPGDVSWHLRLADDELVDTIHSWWKGRSLAAVALIEGPVARPRLSPPSATDHQVTQAVAGYLDALPHNEVWSDAWYRMAEAPGFDPRLDLIARDDQGTAVATPASNTCAVGV
jgi:hypothetical protein